MYNFSPLLSIETSCYDTKDMKYFTYFSDEWSVTNIAVYFSKKPLENPILKAQERRDEEPGRAPAELNLCWRPGSRDML